jgi:hypothetical protein
VTSLRTHCRRQARQAARRQGWQEGAGTPENKEPEKLKNDTSEASTLLKIKNDKSTTNRKRTQNEARTNPK